MVLPEGGDLLSWYKQNCQKPTFVRRITSFNLSVVATLCIAAAATVSAQQPDHSVTSRDLDRPRFSIDYAQFRSDSANLTRLEVYYRVPNSGLTFLPKDSGYEARFEMIISLYQGKSQVHSRSEIKKLFVEDYARTRLSSDFLINQISFDVPSAKYKIVARLSDLNGAGDRALTRDCKVNDYSRSKWPRVSDLEFLYSSARGTGAPRFQKGEVSVVPSVERAVMGGVDGGPLLLYFELYPGEDTLLNVLVDTRIRTLRGTTVYRDTLYQRINAIKLAQIRSVSIEKLSPGPYSISAEVFVGSSKKPVTRAAGEFMVRWSLLATVRDDYETVLDQLELVATHAELEVLKAATTPDSRIEAWRLFWESRDPTPGSADNEAREEFYRRLEYVNGAFGVLRKDGWRTDRGRTYVKYGSPDEINYEVMPLSTGAWEVWYYNNYGGEPRRFVFLDEIGDGDYRLQYPFDGRY